MLKLYKIAEGTSLSLAGRAAPSSGPMVLGPSKPADPLIQPPRHSTSLDTPLEGLLPGPMHHTTDGRGCTGANGDISPSLRSNFIKRECLE
ncbi:UNVERIFIED_CONTAM: hypothetical protein Slati_0148400 [Sesamum latifolium]|uniref:Uncharacterized protein n=1 Tax=Sesamum latifolium TaxID=2727402 RepID=A0AAW2YA28_9LAMI